MVGSNDGSTVGIDGSGDGSIDGIALDGTAVGMEDEGSTVGASVVVGGNTWEGS